MRRNRLVRFVIIIVLAAVIFFLVQSLGKYLIGEISSYNEPLDPNQVSVEVIEKTILRLEPMEYYTCHVGAISDLTLAQGEIDLFAQKGYRVYAVGESPYHLYLGCWGQDVDLTALPDEFQQIGADVYIAKNTLNNVSLKFKDSEQIYSEHIAPLIASIDVLIKQSLKMFETPQYDQYAQENWQSMITALNEELEQIDTQIAVILMDEEEIIAQEMLKLSDALQGYQQGLEIISQSQNDKSLYLAQSYLLALIDCYHGAINNLSAQ